MMDAETRRSWWKPLTLGLVAAVIGGVLGLFVVSQVLADHGGHGRGGHAGHRGGQDGGQDGKRWEEKPAAMQAEYEAFAEVLGTDLEGLKAALADGQTLAEIAESNDVDVQDVVDHLMLKIDARIDAALESGKLTEEQAAAMRSASEERMTNMVNGEQQRSHWKSWKRGRGHHGWRGHADSGSDASNGVSWSKDRPRL